MNIKVYKDPDRKITQSALYFQFRFMEWTPEDLENQDDRYGSVPFAYVVGYEGDEIVGVINLHKRIVDWKDKKVILGGIGGVCTHSGYKRRGIATKLLKESMEVLKEIKCDVAFLCTDLKTLASLYGQVGFTALNREYMTTGLSGKVYKDVDGMIASVNSDKIFTEILEDKNTFDLQGQEW